ncbi:MAG TPA: hypothetical protein VIT45_11485 [Allosphingosinicella sp.]
MSSGISYLVEQWGALRQVSGAFLLAIIVVASAIFAGLQFLFRTRLESKDAIIEELKSKLAHRTEDLEEVRLQMRDLAAPVDHAPPTDAKPTHAAVPHLVEKDAQRDVSVPEALAYAELHQWGLRFIDAAGTDNNHINERTERLEQLAADGELTIWGKRNGVGLWVRVPAEHWLNNEIEWFGLLRGEARSLSRSGSDVELYSALMTSKLQVERHFAPPAPLFMQILHTNAAPIAILQQRIHEARARIEDMDATDTTLAKIRQDMAALAHSKDEVWQNNKMEQARSDLLKLWEGIYRNARRARLKDLGNPSPFPNYFRSVMEKNELLAMIDDAIARLDAGIEGRDVPPPTRFGSD